MAVLHLSVIVSIILSRTVLAALAIRPATNAMRVKGTGNFDVEYSYIGSPADVRLAGPDGRECTDAMEMDKLRRAWQIGLDHDVLQARMDRVLKTKLVATVDITPANLERASWYDIWAATVAISGMCVRNGKGGSSAYLGDGGKMSVTITEEPA
ncbi:MAG: hypothetical protein L6R35_005695 [Caloplaca aegaea]|nr:MAG: hypothetical protein L6R35_005695 [Caloplaca aegaea]